MKRNEDFNKKVIETLGRIFVPPIRILSWMFETKTQLIDTYNKILMHRCLYMEDITFNNVIELGPLVCAFVHDNLRNGLTDLNASFICILANLP